MAKKLLRGQTFSDVDHIGRPGLEELNNHLRGGGVLKYEPPTAVTEGLSDGPSEHDLLLSEKRKSERALNRLKQLFLFSDDSMTETDYIVERQRLLDTIEDIDERLAELEHSSAGTNMSDEEFIAKASYFIFAQKLQARRQINYESFIRKIDPQIPKNFINSAVQNFCIRDGKIASVQFKNGIKVQFL